MSEENTDSQVQNPSFFTNAVSYLKLFGSCITLWGIGYMRFSATWVALGSFGYFCINIARTRRKQLSGSLKEIGENEKRFFVKNFTVGDLPSWVYFPDVERAEWVNRIIKRMWPNISDYAKDIILQSIAPALESQLPAALTPFEFVTIDLGDTTPRIGGVKVYMHENIRRDEVIMDLDIMLYSDARIKVKLGKIKAGVKEFELRGTLRVVLKPLISKVPFFGAVTVCFLDSPYINFQLTDMGNILGLPGLQQTLDTVVRNVINQLIVLPNRLPVQLVDDLDVRKLKYPMPQGVIRISVLGARRLKIGDKALIGTGSSDPYCVVRVGARTFKTSVIQKTVTPEWNEHFEAIVDVKRGQSLQLAVFDKDKGNKDDPLGTASVSLESVYVRGVLDTWTKLESVKTGSVHMKLTWLALSSQEEDVTTAVNQALYNRTEQGTSLSAGFLYLVVEQAKNLRRVKQMREPSPYCNLLLGREAQATETRERTQNPTWDSVHHFLIGDPYVDKLQLIIRDNRSETLLGKCTVEIKRLLTEQDMTLTCPFRLEQCGSDEATVYLHLEFKALVPVEPRSLSQVDGIEIDEEREDLLEDEDTDGSGLDLPSTPTQPEMGTELRRREIMDHSKSPVRDIQSPSPTTVADDEVCEPWKQFANASPPLGELRVTLDYRSASSMLSITVHEARNLIGIDKDGLADPYVNVYLVDDHGQMKGEKRKTAVMKDQLNPVFEASFSFELSFDELPDHQLRFDVKNHVGMLTFSRRTHYMGSVMIDLCKYANSEQSETNWYALLSSDAVSNADGASVSST